MTKSSKDTDKAAPTAEQQHIDDMLDEAGDESFPASDPPSWTSRGVKDNAVATKIEKTDKRG